jgi:hypothetical protein
MSTRPLMRPKTRALRRRTARGNRRGSTVLTPQ